MKHKKAKKAGSKSASKKKAKIELGKIVKIPLDRFDDVMIYAKCEDGGCATKSYGGSWGEG